MGLHKGGQNICGATIGVLCLESYFPKLPGHIKNPSGLPFPVLYEQIKSVTVPDLLNAPSAELLEPFLQGARALAREGVRAITGSCGFLALYQKELAAAVDVPVFASSLIQVPLAFHMTGGTVPVGVLTADARALTPAHLAGVGAQDIPVIVQGLEHSREFAPVVLRNERCAMDTELVAEDVLLAARALKQKAPDLRALVLECTDLPPFAWQLQDELKIAVFDLTTLACMAHDVVTRRPYAGVMPW